MSSTVDFILWRCCENIPKPSDDGGARAKGANVIPLPRPIPGDGYARYLVEFDGFEFEFASAAEMRECIDVLGNRLMPQSRTLGAGRGARAESHWLSRFPASVKPWKYRERAVRFLGKCHDLLAAGGPG